MFSNMFPVSDLPGSDGNPSTMKGNELLMGYGVAVIVVIVGVLDLAVTTGAGAPAHPSTWAPIAGIVLGLALALTMRFRNRLVSPFIAIFAAFFVELAKAPKSLSIPHVVALIAAVGFALVLSMRQRREQRAVGGPAQRRGAADARRRRRSGEPEPPTGVKRPAPSARYTPPKSKTPPKR
jgi:hypothetical protein